MRRLARATGLVVATTVVAGAAVGEAHRPISSRYTYTRDVLPIFRERCGACHRPGGVAPMSLLRYEDARPWAQAIKEEVMALRMPPRYAERGVGPVRNGHGLSAREIDIIVDWASGGTPEGPAVPAPPARPTEDAWPLGPPDRVLTLPEPFTLAADRTEATHTVVVPAGLAERRWVRAVDIRPGVPAIVRSVVVAVARGPERPLRQATGASGAPRAPGGVDEERAAVLAVWTPGQEPMALDGDAAYELPAGARLTVQVRYKKTWQQEGQAVSDRTAIGLYFQKRPRPSPVRALRIAPSPGAARDAPGSPVMFDARVPNEIALLALTPELSAPLDTVRIDLVRPDGERQPLLLLSRPSPEWPARYVLGERLRLPRGSRVAVAASGPLALRLEYVPWRPARDAAARRRQGS